MKFVASLLLLGAAAAQDDASSLILRLDDDDPAMREEAMFRLIEKGDAVVADLEKRLKSAPEEMRARIRQILDSPYRGLDRKAIEKIDPIARRIRELVRLSNVRDEGGIHGAHHDINEKQERELWGLLAKLPRHRGAPQLLLAAIDKVYLAYHANGYHGWIWHWPYFDCAKAVRLARRLEKDHPEFAEDALWTRIYCHRIKGLDGKKYPYNEAYKDYATVKAQTRWKADPKKVEALCLESLERFPKGKYAERIQKLLDRADLEVGLPTSWGQDYPKLDRR